MTLAQLNYFVKVAENGHLTQTAKELLIAQPSLTQAIRKLEEELGFLLFEKKGRVLRGKGISSICKRSCRGF